MKLMLIFSLLALSLYGIANDLPSDADAVEASEADTIANDQPATTNTVNNDQPATTNTVTNEQPVITNKPAPKAAINQQPKKVVEQEQPLDIDSDNEQSLNYEPIAIDGKYAQKTSQKDRMKNFRAKLEKQNELMVKRKIESLRLKREMQMTKKLQKIFNQQMQALNSIN